MMHQMETPKNLNLMHDNMVQVFKKIQQNEADKIFSKITRRIWQYEKQSPMVPGTPRRNNQNKNCHKKLNGKSRKDKQQINSGMMPFILKRSGQ